MSEALQQLQDLVEALSDVESQAVFDRGAALQTLTQISRAALEGVEELVIQSYERRDRDVD